MHEKHRERLRKKFSADPLIMEKHEILELLLTFCIPRKNTNNIAHELLDTFGSFSEILSSNPEDLKIVKGIGENTALFLKLLKTFFNICFEEKNKLSKKIKLNSLTLEDAKNIMLTKFINADEEKVALAVFNAKRRIVFCDFIESGSLKFVDVDFRKIVSISFKYNAKYVIIAHNHPSQTALPSKEDITITNQLEFTLKNLGINLLDHLILCGNDCVSLRECKVISEKGQSENGLLQKAG